LTTDAKASAAILALMFGVAVGWATGSPAWAAAGAIGIAGLWFVLYALAIDPGWTEDEEHETERG